MSAQTSNIKLAPLIPCDPHDRALAQIVWRLPLRDFEVLDCTFELDPVQRIRRFLQVVASGARDEPTVRELLRSTTILDVLKETVAARLEEHSGHELELRPTPEVSQK